MDTVVPVDIPESVAAAQERASERGFELSSEAEVGQLMACLANAVAIGGRILEIGTGCGVGLSWIVHGVGSRTDVEVVSVELDPALADATRSVGWPSWVSIVEGDGADLVGTIGSFDLIFPDTPGGKIFKLRKTISTLRPGGFLLINQRGIRTSGGWLCGGPRTPAIQRPGAAAARATTGVVRVGPACGHLVQEGAELADVGGHQTRALALEPCDVVPPTLGRRIRIPLVCRGGGSGSVFQLLP